MNEQLERSTGKLRNKSKGVASDLQIVGIPNAAFSSDE
jgi:hypothetical protein